MRTRLAAAVLAWALGAPVAGASPPDAAAVEPPPSEAWRSETCAGPGCSGRPAAPLAHAAGFAAAAAGALALARRSR